MQKLSSSTSVGVDPKIMGIGPVPAVKKALKIAKWKIDEVDLIEANEAFAAQSLAVINELELDKHSKRERRSNCLWPSYRSFQGKSNSYTYS